jgi:hypothetical protein
MKRQTKLNSENEQRTEQQAQHQAEQQTAHEFANADEMLRHDAIHTPVPPAIANRLRESIGQAPPPTRAWWQRWFKS